jgi:hypothetical protein
LSERKVSNENSVARMAKFRKAALRNRSHNLLPSAKLVLFDLLEHYNHATGQCNPSHKTIAKNLGVSSRTVDRAIEQLKHTGWLEVDQRFNNSCMYSFDWDGPATDELMESALADAMPTPVTMDDDTPVSDDDIDVESYRHPCRELSSPVSQVIVTDGVLTNEITKERTREGKLPLQNDNDDEDDADEVQRWIQARAEQEGW